MRVIDPFLIRKARPVGRFLFSFLRDYNKFINDLILVTQGKFDGDFIVYIDDYLKSLIDKRAILGRYISVDGLRYIRRIGKRLLKRMEILREKGKTDKEIIAEPAVRLLFTKISGALADMVLDSLGRVQRENASLGFKKKIRRFRNIPVLFVYRDSPPAINEEAEEKAIISKEVVREQIRENNQSQVEYVAAEQGLVVDRARMFGKVVFVGMRPEDKEKLEDATSDLKMEQNVMVEEKKSLRDDISRLQRQRLKVDDAEAAEIDDEIFEKKKEIRGNYTGEWVSDEDVGQWEAIKESSSTTMIRSSVKVSSLAGMWSFKGVHPRGEVVKLIVNKKGIVRPREEMKVAGRLYEENGTLSGWLRFDAKTKIELKPGFSQPGLDDSIKEVKNEIKDIREQVDRYVYDPEEPDMQPVPIDEWADSRRNDLGEDRRMSNVLDVAGYLEANKDFRIPDELIEEALNNEADVNWRALSDSKVLDRNAVSHMFPTVGINGVEYIAKGQLKGYPVNIVINKAGRMIKGSAYTSDENGMIRPIEMKKSTGEMDYCVKNEPYVTVSTDGQMMIVMPTVGENSGANNPAVDVLEEMSDISSTIKRNKHIVEKYSRTVVYNLTEADVDDMREALGSLTLSPEASSRMKTYYKERQSMAQSLTNETVEDLTPSDIPGMKEFIETSKGPRKTEFRSYQKKTISYIKERGNGILGLGTGLGKSVSMIATLLTWIEDGTLDQRNGKALFVVPASLRGNIPSEIYKFCENPDEVLDRIEVVSYDGFSKIPHEDLEKFGAVFFDEAQALKNAVGPGASGVGQHALELNHPHKILATASVMEKSAADLYNLYLIANNGYNLEREEVMEEMNNFLRDNFVMSGSRPLAVKNNPQAVDRMRAWVKKNFLYVDKESVRDEIGLQGVTPSDEQTKQVTLPDEAADAYMDVVSEVSDTMKKMQDKYKDKAELGGSGIRHEVHRSNVMGAIQELREISNDFELYQRKHLTRDLAQQLYGKNLLKKDRLTKDEKKVIKEMVDERVPPTPNPKIDRCKTVVEEAVVSGKKVAVWTDQPTFAVKIAKELSEEFPGRHIALCLADSITVVDSTGGIVDVEGSMDGKICQPIEIDGKDNCKSKATYRAKSGYKYPDGSNVPSDQWQNYIMDNVLKVDTNIAALVLTGSYATGHNLQWLSKVVHMDRDNWNNEIMEQRSARTYRQGQPEDVTIEIIDAVMPEGKDAIAINEVQKWMMEMEAEMFDEVVRKAMTEALAEKVVGFSTAQKMLLKAKAPITFEEMSYMMAPDIQSSALLNGIETEESD